MINNVSLTGRLTKDVDLRYTTNGVAVGSFTIAVNRAFKTDGQPDADFINCVVWRKPAENMANFTKKGSLVGVVGKIQTRTYDGQNGTVYVTEVIADSVSFLEPKASGSGEKTGEPKADPFGGSSKTIDITDDDLPF